MGFQYATDPTYPLFPIFSIIGFVLVLTPLPWHFQAWNAGTCLYMIWAGVSCLNFCVNSIVWHGNALNPAPIWCDISTRIIVASAVAIPAASLCINRRLYKIASSPSVVVSRAQKRRAVIEDLSIGLGIPFVSIFFELIVNGHRFNIYEDIGCFPVVINVWLSYPLVACWPIVIGLISAVYCILTLRSFYKRQEQFNQMLASNSALTKHRYFRLMALATTELVCTTPFAAYSIFLNVTTNPMTPYRGWDDLHFDYWRVDQVPALLWRLNPKNVIAFELTRWMVVACAFVFFMFFGFADEARRNYKNALNRIMKRMGMKPESLCFRRMRKPALLPLNLSPSEKKGIAVDSRGILPVFIARPRPSVPRDSFLSTLPSESNEKLVRSDSVSAPSTRMSSSSTTLTLPPLSKTDTKDVESPYSESYGHAY
ncbi:STE3-domain-containing protein [Schizopora paradoxa]|uniref:STE3-domain-containing protein n=1 Tax=Schizopora paradoxa TaxID=27342 RepID=A0A0H2SHJ8_9AGAM|nr:STE3-domain-containing protein [Schizopora paradoxa]